jgi:Phage tail lysozyme
MIALAFAAIAVGVVLVVAGVTDSSLLSVAQGHPDHAGPSPQLAGGTEAPSSASSPSSPVARGKGESVAQLALRYFQGKGWSKAQAAGIVGNLQQESGLDPNAPGGFLAQWGGSRLAGLEAFARQRGSQVSNPALQLEYIQHELETTESGSAAALRRARTPSEAARAFSEHFERPGIPMLGNRERYAEAAARL